MPLIPLDQITRNPDQPRSSFPKEHIEQIAASIRERGLIQPITLRLVGRDQYQIVAGECRFRAHQMIGAETIRAEIVEIDNREMRLRASVENLLRLDMNPMEEAFAFRDMIGDGMTVAEIVKALGFKGRDRVQNRLNLLELNSDVQQLVLHGHLTTSVASAIALAPPEHQTRLVKELNNGTLRNVDQVRHAGQALRNAAAQLDAFAELPAASQVELEGVRMLERQIEQIAQMVISGFDEGRCVVAQRVAPDRVKTMADKLLLIRKHVLQMEHALRCVAAQIEITKPEGERSEDNQHPATVGMANRKRTKGRREQNVAHKVPRASAGARVRQA